MGFRLTLLALAVAGLLGLLTFPAHAAGSIIYVTSTANTTGGTDCTLQNAIAAANGGVKIGGCDATAGAPYLIELAPNATYIINSVVDTNLSGYPSGLPVIQQDMTINGNGATVRGSAGTPPLSIFTIYVATLTLNNVSVRGVATSTYQGGAIYNYNGTLKLNDSLIQGNLAGGDGGGVFNGGTAIISNTTFDGNSAQRGGAIYSHGPLSVLDGTFVNNQSNQGSAIYSEGGLVLTNSTLTHNSASQGGALYVAAGTATIVNTTLANNQPTVTGSAVWSDVDGVTFKNTLLLGNGSGQACNRTFTGTHNLSDDSHCGDFTVKSVDAIQLGALGDNGGLTQTMGLGGKSVALDAGDDATCAAAVGAPAFGAGGRDQRGAVRPAGAHCDIGAFEGTLIPTPTPSPTATPTTGGIQPPPNGPTFTPTRTPAPNVPTFTPTSTPKAGTGNNPTVTPTLTSPTTAACANPYIARPGDSLNQIAFKCGVSPMALAAVNGLWNPNWIRSGQRLRLPNKFTPSYPPAPTPYRFSYIVRSGDTLYSIAARCGISANALAAANHISNPNWIYAGQRLIIP